MGAVTCVKKWGSLPGTENCSPLLTTPDPSNVHGLPDVPHVGSLGAATAGLTSIWLSSPPTVTSGTWSAHGNCEGSCGPPGPWLAARHPFAFPLGTSVEVWGVPTPAHPALTVSP